MKKRGQSPVVLLFWDFGFDIPFSPCFSPYQNGVRSALVFPKRSMLRFGKVVAVSFGFACAFIAPAINGVEPQSTKRPQSLCVLCDLCG